MENKNDVSVETKDYKFKRGQIVRDSDGEIGVILKKQIVYGRKAYIVLYSGGEYNLFETALELFDFKSTEPKKPQTSEEIINAIFDMLPIEPNREYEFDDVKIKFDKDFNYFEEDGFGYLECENLNMAYLIANIDKIKPIEKQSLSEKQEESCRYFANKGIEWIAKFRHGSEVILSENELIEDCNTYHSESSNDLILDARKCEFDFLEPMQLMNISKYREKKVE